MTAQKQTSSWMAKNAFLLLFMLLSIVIWVVTKLSNTYQTPLQLPVVIQGIPDSLLLKNTPELELNVEGTGLDLLRLNMVKKPIQIPFEAFDYQDATLQLGMQFQRGAIQLQFPENVRLLQWKITPSALGVDIRVSKKIPVRWDLQLTFESGYRMFEPFQISPDSVRVSGNALALDSLNYWKIPPLKKELPSGPFQLETQQLPPEHLVLSHSTFRVQGESIRYVEQRLTLDIQAVGLDSGTRIRLYPAQTELTYQIPLEDAANFDSAQLRVNALFNQRSVEGLQLPLKLQNIPSRFISVRLEPNQVQYLIRRD